MFLNSTLESIYYLFFPHHCIVCRRSLNQRKMPLCAACFTALNKVEDDGKMQSILFASRSALKRHLFSSGMSLVYFSKSSTAQSIVHTIKYHHNKKVAFWVGSFMATAVRHKKVVDVDVLVPVPLHKEREQERTYNQAMVIGEGLSEVLHIPVAKNLIVRTKKTQSQTTLHSEEERKKNVHNAFTLTAAASQYVNKHLLLIDDVLTTGSTISACASVLSSIPQARISFLTFAITEI